MYAAAPALHEPGGQVVSTDEMTGLQALERAAPTLPRRPGAVERREFEYVRHGTQTLIANFAVATGEVVTPAVGPTRTAADPPDADCAAQVDHTVATDPTAAGIFVVDHRDLHRSEALGRLVAARCELTDERGVKDKAGILKSMATRTAFLPDPTHRRRFVSTPKHCSWLNQVAIWFSILVRTLLRRASFVSTDALRARLLAFITDFHRTMAKPFKWTYSGRPLVA